MAECHPCRSRVNGFCDEVDIGAVGACAVVQLPDELIRTMQGRTNIEIVIVKVVVGAEKVVVPGCERNRLHNFVTRAYENWHHSCDVQVSIHHKLTLKGRLTSRVFAHVCFNTGSSRPFQLPRNIPYQARARGVNDVH